MTCTGVILAGGLATRYDGRPKGLELVGGIRIIDRVAAALRHATDDLLLIANAPDAHEWLPGVRTAADLVEGAGGLGGIHSALSHAGTDILIVAWDMPFVPADLLATLRSRAAATAVDAVVPVSDTSRRGVEPLCAFYSSACLLPVAARLEAGDRRVIAFFDDVRVDRLALGDVSTFGDPATMFMNVNTPSDLERAESFARATAADDRRP